MDQIGWDQKNLTSLLGNVERTLYSSGRYLWEIGSFIGHMADKKTESLPPIIAYQCFLPFAPEEEQENAEGV